MNSVLKEKRKQLGLTQAQTAKACGVSRRTYQTYEEKPVKNATYDNLLALLEEMGYLDKEQRILSIREIKSACRFIFKKYKGVECAYLYGSYARGEATRKSDVDILVVCPPMGLDFYGMAAELEESLHKQVDLQTHRQIGDNEAFVAKLLIEGIKIYG